MAAAFPSWSVLVFLPPILLLLVLYAYHRLVTAKYWSNRGVHHLKPFFIMGNFLTANTIDNISLLIKKWHCENRKHKLLGFWAFLKPNLLVMDLDLTKRILIRDFNNFRDRGIEVDTEREPLAGHLFLLNGKKWRNLRVKLTPTFTSGKMKMMFPTMVRCGEELGRYLNEAAAERKVIEVKDLLARFTTDVISSCAFGLETNSLQNPKSVFREYGKRIFTLNWKSFIVNLIFGIHPALLKLLKLRLIPKDVSDFFLNTVRETVEYREKNNMKRNDFLQLIIQLMRAGKLEDADRTPIDGLDDDELVNKFSLNDAAAQCFVFFAAGFETSSTALTFALYELALNPDIQVRLQEEIDEMLSKSDNQLTYEHLCGLEYLDMVVQETLRKYPPVGNLQRKCQNDYYVPEHNLTIEKGMTLQFSVLGIHYDPDIYPDPERFDPERFSAEEKSKRDSCAFLPFGEGPRNCIGNRFGLMQIKVGLASILKGFTVEVCRETPIPVVYEVRSFIPTPVGGMNLVFSKRRQ